MTTLRYPHLTLVTYNAIHAKSKEVPVNGRGWTLTEVKLGTWADTKASLSVSRLKLAGREKWFSNGQDSISFSLRGTSKEAAWAN